MMNSEASHVDTGVVCNATVRAAIVGYINTVIGFDVRMRFAPGDLPLMGLIPEYRYAEYSGMDDPFEFVYVVVYR